MGVAQQHATMRLALTNFLFLSLLSLAVGGCVADVPSGSGTSETEASTLTFAPPGKADGFSVQTLEVPFTVDADGLTSLDIITYGRLSLTLEQDGSQERLQFAAYRGEKRRRSWRGRSPRLTLASTGRPVRYRVDLHNWGGALAKGTIHAEVELDESPIEVVFNDPECDGCEDRTNGLRDMIVSHVQAAQDTIDFAIYGFGDQGIIDALCQAVEDGVTVRVLTDDHSMEPGSRSYYEGLYSTEGLMGCGAELMPVKSSGLMHHKFMLIDYGTDDARLLTGSTNMTQSGLEEAHNHMLSLRNADGVFDAYYEEFEQLFGRCAVNRQDSRTCNECTPSCVEDRMEQGPFNIGTGDVEVFFSPSDDPIRRLRGLAHEERLDAPDPACAADDADCICRPWYGSYKCAYCAEGEDGYGLIGQARDRLLVNMFSATDMCFAKGIAKAAQRGVETSTLWDVSSAASSAAIDELVCGLGVETFLAQHNDNFWAPRNHSKTVIVDDVLFNGSMNISLSGASRNNENTLVIHDAATAQRFADYFESERASLLARGVTPLDQASCLCALGDSPCQLDSN